MSTPYSSWHGKQVRTSIVPLLEAWTHGHSGFTVTSGLRTAARNKQVGGAKNSRHLMGVAVDIVGPKTLLDHLQRTASSHGAVEVLRESDHLHVGWPRPASRPMP